MIFMSNIFSSVMPSGLGAMLVTWELVDLADMVGSGHKTREEKVTPKGCKGSFRDENNAMEFVQEAMKSEKC